MNAFDVCEHADKTTSYRTKSKDSKYVKIVKASSIPTDFRAFVISTFGGKNKQERDLSALLAFKLAQKWTITIHDAMSYVNSWIVGSIMKDLASFLLLANSVIVQT